MYLSYRFNRIILCQVGDSDKRMDGYCEQIRQLSTNTVELSSKIRFACRDVLDSRDNNWAKRGAALVEKYKTADEFREQEERRAKAIPSTPSSSSRGGRGGSGDARVTSGQHPGF